MKNILLTFSILVIFIFASCGNKQNKTKDTHTHPDGTVHSDADHSSPSVSSAQEAFEVKVDSSTIDKTLIDRLAIKKAIADSLAKVEQHKHNHKHGHNHSH